MKTGRRIIQSVVLFDLAAFVLFFIWAAWQRRADLVIPLHATRWELSYAFLLLVKWMPALQFLALAVAIGSLEGKGEDLFRSSILPAILVSAILAALALVLAPGAEARKGDIDRSSQRFNGALEEARLALDQGRVADARRAYATVEAIDHNDFRATALDERLRGAELRAARQKAALEPLTTPARDKARAVEEFGKAAEYARQRDWYAAWWHAGQAQALDPALAEAKRLQAQAWGEILDRGGGEKDARRVAFYTRKVEAYARLHGGDPVTAYGLFLELAAESPGDQDVHRYLGESLQALEREAFFTDEADQAALSADFPDFVIMLPGKAGGKLALAAREIAFTQTTAFLFDLEYLEIDASGLERAHYLSPYGKLVSGKLLLESVDRGDPTIVYRPRSADGGAAPRSLEVGLEAVETYRFAAGMRRPRAASVLELFAAAKEAPGRFLDEKPYLEELLRRLGMPFALFGATVLGTILGLRFRDPLRKPSKAAWLALPFMALVSAALWALLESIDASVARWTLELVRGPVAMAANAGIRALALALLVVIAANVREPHAVDEAAEADAGS